jgi:hypothetical protein
MILLTRTLQHEQAVLPEIVHSTSSRKRLELELGIAVYSNEEKAELRLIYDGQRVAAEREGSAVSTDVFFALLETCDKQEILVQ